MNRLAIFSPRDAGFLNVANSQRINMTDFQDLPVIGELTNIDITDGRSRFAIFLDGDATNTDEENIIDEGYFDNCYSFDQFMEDYLIIDWLRVERENLQAELQKVKQEVKLLLSKQQQS
jgi:hypothetical protein